MHREEITVLLKRDDPDLAARVVAGEITPNTTALTWGEFVETRLLANYRDEDDIPVRRMRRAIEVLRKE